MRVVLFGGNFQDLSPGDSISSSPLRTAPRKWGGRREGVEETGYIEVCNKEQVVWISKVFLSIKENQISQVKEFSVSIYGKWTSLGSLKPIFSYASQISWVFTHPKLLRTHHKQWLLPCCSVAKVLFNFLTAACQASLSFTISWSLLELISTVSVIHHSLPFLLSIFPSIRVFTNELAFCIRWPNYWSFNFSLSNEYSGLISFRIDWIDLLSVQGTLKSLLQHHSSKASILWHLAFFIVQLSHLYITTGKTIALTIWTFVSKVVSLLNGVCLVCCLMAARSCRYSSCVPWRVGISDNCDILVYWYGRKYFISQRDLTLNWETYLIQIKPIYQVLERLLDNLMAFDIFFSMVKSQQNTKQKLTSSLF